MFINNIMVCITNCTIAAGFIISSLVLALSSDKNRINEELVNSLTQQQKYTYAKIVNERKQLFVEGYVLGLIISLGVIMLNNNKKMMNNMTTICTVVMISGFTNYFYYTLMPKSDYMLLHLHSNDQTKKWLEMYKHMKSRCHIGFIIGLIGAGFLGNGLCK